jgi:ribosomal protein S18 acetylase RimI-like enzyme
MDGSRAACRVATVADAERIGALLHDFNSEFGDRTPGAAALAGRMRTLIASSDTAVLLIAPDASAEADGLAVLRFREAIWDEALECYLAELYVAPARRGEGLGRALLESAIAHARDRGASHMELGTAESDVVARALYESLGFSNREGSADGPLNYYYERAL